MSQQELAKKKKRTVWSLYIVECSDGTLYTGITTDVKRRIEEHNHSPKGAKYTASRRPVTLRCSHKIGERAEASRAEYRIKRLQKEKKLQYCKNIMPCD